MPYWIGAGASLAVALLSGLGHARRQRRRRIDDVGFVPWQSVQLLALLGVLVLVSLAVKAG